ncbi:MAG: response regulator [Candidatus Omnitrophica bacterium]|nr:response regulator [Candidatus Omnitrophota bacterium]
MQKPYKVLLAIDDTALTDYCKLKLKDYCVVYVVDSSSRVYEIMHEAQIDLAVLDYSLPQINPIELHEGMEFLHPDTTIVLCVTRENREVATRIWHKRAIDYIQKPLDGPRLIDDINKVLRYIVAQDYVRRLEQRILQLEKELNDVRKAGGKG